MQHPDYRLIPMRNRSREIVAFVIVDAANYEIVRPYRWWLGGGGYASRALPLGAMRRRAIMHRELLGLALDDPRHVDHINRNRLDNRRANLRIATPAENGQNTSGWRNSSSRYRGVTWEKRRKHWIAQAEQNGKRIYLGSYSVEEEAAQAAAAFRAAHMPYAVD